MTVAAAASAGRWARAAAPDLWIAAPSDVLRDYALFLASRDVADLRSFDGPHARRDVMELAVLLREIHHQLPEARPELTAIDSYQRALVELRAGRISALGTTVWQVDLQSLGKTVLPSPALLPKGGFVVGLYTAAFNRKALDAKRLRDLQTLSVVSNSDWTADWSTLKALGFQQMVDMKTWRQMVLSVARGRADVMLAPFPASDDLLLLAEGVTLLPIRDVSLAVQGSRHLAASSTPGGQAIAESVFPALGTLVANGSLKRAYRECGFINARTSQWQVLNL
ncbi:hypothetical protein [Rhodoferax bucti]|uniref:hypothetical protein n=1 Tax=Rhodoferax bucti TaxID=2576305 RepID=UPI00197E21EA|nr:hypothetical protein [Rhodoferax bucti]